MAGLPSDPRTVVTWNANGLAPRAKNAANLDEFRRLLRVTGAGIGGKDTSCSSAATAAPDLVLIQEARLKRSPSSAAQPRSEELREVEPFLNICRQNGYVPIWSLAQGRNAGTLSLVKMASNSSNSTKNNKDWTAFTLGGALTLMMAGYGLEKDADLVKLVQEFGSENEATDTSGAATNGSKQSTMMAFMKKRPAPSAGGAGLPSPSKHDAEGRIQFLRFANMDLLHTYVPNNGRTAESNKRRRTFDLAIRKFLSLGKSILAKAGDTKRPIIWAGDLNVSRTHLDGTHHTVHPTTGAVSEYWTDESQCYSRKDVANADRSRPRGDIGIPGFTPNERSRFEETLQEAGLNDVWRELHPNGVETAKLPYLGRHGGTDEANCWDRANYTWRGTQGRNQAMARYQGKGQRIDYFLISNNGDGSGDGGIMGRVVSCDILGYGESRQGYFCGSDHCPMALVLKNEDGDMKKGSGGAHDDDNTDYDTDGADEDSSDRKMPAKKKSKVAEKEVIDLT